MAQWTETAAFFQNRFDGIGATCASAMLAPLLIPPTRVGDDSALHPLRLNRKVVLEVLAGVQAHAQAALDGAGGLVVAGQGVGGSNSSHDPSGNTSSIG